MPTYRVFDIGAGGRNQVLTRVSLGAEDADEDQGEILRVLEPFRAENTETANGQAH